MMEKSLADMELRVAALEQATQQIISTWIPWLRDSIEELKRGGPRPSGSGGPRTYHRNWRDYVKAQIYRKQGMSIRQISLAMGLSYSTCHNYFYLRENDIAKLREVWELDRGPLDEAALARECVRS